MFFAERGIQLLTRYREQQTLEREKLTKHKKKCFAHLKKYLEIGIDGMDQKKTRLSHWPRVPKSVDESCLIQLYVVGCLIYFSQIFTIASLS